MLCLKLVVIFSCIAAIAMSEPPSGFIPCEDCRICSEHALKTRIDVKCRKYVQRPFNVPCTGPEDSDFCIIYREVCLGYENVIKTYKACISYDMKPDCICDTWVPASSLPVYRFPQ